MAPVTEAIQVAREVVEEQTAERREEKAEVLKKAAEDELRHETDSPRRSVTPNAGNGGRKHDCLCLPVDIRPPQCHFSILSFKASPDI